MYSTEDSRHHHQLPPVIPPSPTLSNPDMILPFDDNERENSTPSPPFNLPSLSHLQSFYENRTYGNEYTHDSTKQGMSRPQKKGGFPRHTWMHEGHDAASRRLSDIGEEDTSSPPRRVFLRNSQVLLHQGHAIGSSNSIHESEDTEVAEARAHSSSSNSTISAASENSSWDGAKGRQEGYVASQDGRRSSNRQMNDARTTNGARSSPNAPSTNEETGPDEDQSSVILSSEAERILENAKKRLTLMEGNLTRARSSVRASPSQSPSPSPSFGSGLGQPVGGLYQSISRADRRSSTLRPRPTYTSQEQPSNRHSRVYSEANIPSSSLPQVEPNVSRSVSAMGSSSASNFNNDERSFHYAPTRAYLTHRSSISSMQAPSRDSYAAAPNERASSDSPPGFYVSDGQQLDKIASMDDFNSAYPVNDALSRSQSQLQVRDLQDQMKGLHIKISSLKVKAQEDNLRRRSLQSLRTPSPLTAATHWYANPLDPGDRHSRLHPGVGTGYGRSSESPQGSQDSGGKRSSSGHAQTATFHVQEGSQSSLSSPSTVNTSDILPPFELTDHDDGHSVVESLYEDAEEGAYDTDGSSNSEIDRDALEEILREPLEDDDLEEALEAFPAVPQHSDATPHEEREDAFDYEHFILHSALGNYSQARLRRESSGSNTSVETTRPIQDRRSARHSRSNSTNSISTIATFATAREGSHDDFESVLYWDRRFNAEMRHNHNYPESPVEGQHLIPESDSEPSLRTPRASRHGRLSALAVSDRPDSAAAGSATPTSLASSLVSTVRAASSPHPSSMENGNLGINDDDTRLLEHLFKSLGDVCMDLQAITTSPDCDMKQARLLRRRLEAARRVLDGELDT